MSYINTHSTSSSACTSTSCDQPCKVDDCENDKYKHALVHEEKVNREPEPLLPTSPLALQQAARRQSEPRVAVKYNCPWTAVVAAHSTLPNPLVTLTPLPGTVLFWRTSDGGDHWKRVSSPPTTVPELSYTPSFSIVYGPGPSKCKSGFSNARLYFVALAFIANLTDPIATTLPAGLYRYVFSYSDNDGDCWSPLKFIDPVALGEAQAQFLLGGLIEAATDINECSPGFGNLYITYRYQSFTALATTFEGSKIVWTTDYGCKFYIDDLDPVPVCNKDVLAGLPAGAVIDANFTQPVYTRPAVAPNGDVYVASVQTLSYVIPPAITPVLINYRLAVQRLVFKDCFTSPLKKTPVLVFDLAPTDLAPGGFGFLTTFTFNQFAFAINPVTGAIYVGIHTYQVEDTPYGRILFWRSDDCGQCFKLLCIDTRVAGQSSIRPEIAIAPDGKHMVIRFVTLEDLPTGTLLAALVGQYHVFTTNSGKTWSRPQPTTDIRVRTDVLALATPVIGAGLHHRVAALKNRKFISVYADARFGVTLPPTSLDLGNTDVFAALICLPPRCVEPCKEKKSCSTNEECDDKDKKRHKNKKHDKSSGDRCHDRSSCKKECAKSCKDEEKSCKKKDDKSCATDDKGCKQDRRSDCKYDYDATPLQSCRFVCRKCKPCVPCFYTQLLTCLLPPVVLPTPPIVQI